MAHVLVIASRRYNGHELWTALGVMQHRDHTFEVVSTARILRDEITGNPVKIERLTHEVESMKGFDGLMFISGNMEDTEATWYNETALKLVREANAANLPIAAICCSVPAIREATKGKVVSYFPLIRSKNHLEDHGAICSTISISCDQNLVTAEHQMATQVWTETFCELLEGKEPTLKLEDSGFTPGVREAKPDPDLERLKNISRKTGKTGVKQ